MPRLTKKQKIDLQKDDLYRLFILALGFTIDDNGYLRDQDTYNLIVFDGKNIRYTFPNMLYHTNDMVFDPLTSKKQAERLFGNFLERDSIMTNTYYRLYHEVKQVCPDGRNSSSLHIDSSKGTIVTEFYRNETIKFIEAVFKIAHLPMTINLHDYDTDDFRRR